MFTRINFANAPCEYMALMKKQVAGEGSYFGGINTMGDLETNLAENCVPVEFMEMDVLNFKCFSISVGC